MLDQGVRFDVAGLEVLLVLPALGHGAEAGQGNVGVGHVFAVVVGKIGDDLQEAQLAIGLNKEALLIEAGDKHGNLFNLKCLVRGGYIAGTLSEKQDLHLLLLGIQLRLPFCTGSQRTLIDGDILVLAGQNALTSQTVFVEYLLVFACFVKLDGRHLFFILSLFHSDQSTLLRKSCVRLFWGLLNNSSGVFSSTITPPSMNNTRSPTSRAKPIS